MFIENYKATYKRSATKHDLTRVYQRMGELLRSYIWHFSEVRNQIPNILEAEVITCFVQGLYHHDELEGSSTGSHRHRLARCSRRTTSTPMLKKPNSATKKKLARLPGLIALHAAMTTVARTDTLTTATAIAMIANADPMTVTATIGRRVLG